jgi:hypothetical protein
VHVCSCFGVRLLLCVWVCALITPLPNGTTHGFLMGASQSERIADCHRLASERGLALCPRLGPGSLRVALLDMLHLMSREEVEAGVRIEVVPQ